MPHVREKVKKAAEAALQYRSMLLFEWFYESAPQSGAESSTHCCR